jgi:hypothetical protein
MPNPSDPQDPRYPRANPQNPQNPQNPRGPNPRDPRDVNPRDPRGGVGSTLNPTRDHVQGEPEGEFGPIPEPDPPAVEQARDLPPSSEPQRPDPSEKSDPYYYDPTKP